MPIVPNLIERTALLTLNQGPAPMLGIWSGPAFWSVHAALQLDLFVALGTARHPAAALAQAVSADPQGVQLLLDTLCALGYVQKRGSDYANTAMTRKWLLPTGSLNLTPFYLYWGALMQHFMPRLADSVRTGTSMDLYAWLEEQPIVSRHFQEGMVQLARFVAGDILRAVELPTKAQKLLDVGGGHGEYSVAFCERFSQLSALIYDSEQAVVAGRTTVASAGLEDRISTHAGNFLADPLPQDFDVALLFNIVHGLTPEQNVELLRRLRGALRPGGQVLVLDQVHGAAPLPVFNTVTRILSVAYYHLIGGQVYSAEAINQWLLDAGFVHVRRHRITKAGSVLFSATE